MSRLRLAALILLLLALPASAATTTHDLTPQDFTRLAARPLGMGGACVAEGYDEQALFQNPAGLALQKFPRLGSSHSARHFPGSQEDDQLDCDPTSLIWPLSPFITIGNGWITQGELGYAHDHLHDDRFPRQHLWGTERVDGLGLDLLLVQVGAAHRSQSYRYAAPPPGTAAAHQPALDAPDVTMQGEGTAIGTIATVFPGIRYGWMEEKLDQDYFPTGAASYGSTRTLRSSGWSVHPTGWLTLSWQTDKLKYKVQNPDGTKHKEEGPVTHRAGGELLLGGLGALRWGGINGAPTWGATLYLLGARIHWGEAAGQMPRIVNGDWPAGVYEDTHHYSWSVGM